VSRSKRSTTAKYKTAHISLHITFDTVHERKRWWYVYAFNLSIKQTKLKNKSVTWHAVNFQECENDALLMQCWTWSSTRYTFCGTWYLHHRRTVPIIMVGCIAHARNGRIFQLPV